MDPKTSRVKAFFERGFYLKSRALIAMRVDLTRELLGDLHGQRILDLGCGDGSLSLQYVASNEVTLVDVTPQMLEAAERNTPPEHRRRVRFVNAALQDFSASEPFDVVLCVGLLAHLPSIEQGVAKVASLTVRGGRCLLQITDADRWMGRAIHRYSSLRAQLGKGVGYEVARIGHAELTEIAARHGMKQEAQRRVWTILPGMRFLPDSLLLEYQRSTSTSPVLAPSGAEALVLYRRT
jgi:cyclopropane fatty-acyl-phospholipid synthase-like methyltransferase